MTLELVALFALSVTCDILGQIAFKLGADNIPTPEKGRWGAFVRSLVATPWLLAGIGIYVAEFIIWIRILALVPLSIAFPLASLNILGVLAASHLLLGERLGRNHWAGALLIMAGIVLVASEL
ncbi:EamA family transporter [Ancylobacter sp. Lp-2]|uniref:EamA family transporter n=1 Tax=Ancylobacter sp. Lp-2 TaxID=2881339 RepID=UPI001E52C775|nr:EamA family transporter [Ancylobacter sp. Lp-2]MCB4771933.1 EamA family transporter [Ancylobacter sp. Lp-2]